MLEKSDRNQFIINESEYNQKIITEKSEINKILMEEAKNLYKKLGYNLHFTNHKKDFYFIEL